MVKYFFIQNIWFNKADLSSLFNLSIFTVRQIYYFYAKEKIFFLNLPLRVFATVSKTIIPIKLTIKHFPKT